MIVHFFGNVFGIGFGNVSEPEYNISPETVPGKHILLMSSQNQHFVKKQRPVFVLFRQPSLVIFRAKRM
jgi:hypothetical protein